MIVVRDGKISISGPIHEIYGDMVEITIELISAYTEKNVSVERAAMFVKEAVADGIVEAMKQ